MKQVLNYLRNPQWARQHKWRRALWQSLNSIGLTGVHALPLRKSWIEVHRRPMPIHGLAPSFSGLRIVQLSDLHFSPMVWKTYLQHYIQWVNDLSPDLVVITGDLITGGNPYAKGIAGILRHLRAPHGVICTFGNHDYSMLAKVLPTHAQKRGDYLQKQLQDAGLIVLRNQLHTLTAPDGSPGLHLVGLDDAWTGRSNPKLAFDALGLSLPLAADHHALTHPVICLNHNPADALDLMAYPWQWMLSGHTHGRALGTSKVGQKIVGKRARKFTHGYYALGSRHLYVNRGLSYGQRAKHWCRPEVTLFTTTHA